MKRLITLLLLMFVALGVNAQTSSSAPRLTPKESLYGTWVLSMRELDGEELHFTTLLKGKPTKATIYDLDEQ